MIGFGDVCFVGFSHCRVTDIFKIMKKNFYGSIFALPCHVGFTVQKSESDTRAHGEREAAQPCPTLCDPWTAAHQAPQSMGFSSQAHWSGVPRPSQRIFLTQGSSPGLLHWRQMLYRLSHQGSLLHTHPHVSSFLALLPV